MHVEAERGSLILTSESEESSILSEESFKSQVSSDDEVDSAPLQANVFIGGPRNTINVINYTNPILPLCVVLNARSIANKANNMNELLQTLCPQILICSETWERNNARLKDIIKNKQYEIVSFFRKTQRGGGSAIFVDKNAFRITELSIHVPEGI